VILGWLDAGLSYHDTRLNLPIFMPVTFLKNWMALPLLTGFEALAGLFAGQSTG
jgi:hypothetical protein